MDMEAALVHLTSNVAKGLEVYPKKGYVAEGSDADLLLLDENLDIDTVVANGKVMIENKDILVYGSYEQM